MSAYSREASGGLSATELMCLADDAGRVNLGHNYNPCRLTRVGETELRGWGADDGPADVYETEAGREIIVAGPLREDVRRQLS